MSTVENPVVVVNQPATSTQHKSISDKATCLAIGREWPPLTKALPKDFIVTTADKKKVHASKDLFDSPALKRLMNLEMALDSTIKRYASAPFPLKTGVYILGVDLYNDVEAIIAKHLEQREKLIDEFIEAYDIEVAKAKEFQGDAHDPADYPTRERVRAMFKFRWNYLTMDAAENLRKVSNDAVAREKQKLAAEWDDARDACRRILREQMQGMVNHLVDRLSPGEEGKRKIFRNTALDPINEFLRTFDPRDLSGDASLRTLVENAKQLVSGISPEDLRNNDALRGSVQKGFSDIKVLLDQMLIDAPSREIELGEETEQEVVVQ